MDRANHYQRLGILDRLLQLDHFLHSDDISRNANQRHMVVNGDRKLCDYGRNRDSYQLRAGNDSDRCGNGSTSISSPHSLREQRHSKTIRAASDLRSTNTGTGMWKSLHILTLG